MFDDDNKEFAYAFLANRGSYHAQKETSAYTVFLVETGLFSALITTNIVSDFISQSEGCGISLVIFIFVVWCFLHIFMRWQLINRRISALQVGALILALTDHLRKSPTSQGTTPQGGCCLDKYLDYVIPRPKSKYQGDIKLDQYPEWYRERYEIMRMKGTKASFGEIFPTYGSILMLLISIGKVWLSI